MTEDGLQDTAILLMSLGEAEAPEVFKRLSPKEVQKLGEAIARTKTVSHSLLASDSGDYVRAVLNRALGDDKAALLIDRILQCRDVSGIERLKWMDALSVAELLRGEHPQIAAAILVHLDYDQAADVLKNLSEHQRNEMMLRIATMEGIEPIALKDLNEGLFQALSGRNKVRKSSPGGVTSAAEMINLMGTDIEGTVIESIRSHDPGLAQKILDKLFVFDDLIKLDDRSVQMVLREVASDTLIGALQGAQPELREKILANMSSRAAQTLRQDIEFRGAVHLSEVHAQQKEILNVARRLSDQGRIVIGGGGGGAVDTASLLMVALTKARQLASAPGNEEALKKESYAQGFAQGQARAILEAEQKMNDYVASQGLAAAHNFAQLLESAQEQLAQAQQVMAQGVLELACELARQVLRQELTVNPNALQPVLREALGLLAADSTNAVVRLNPVDMALLQDAVQSEFAALSLTLIADASIAPGGCLIASAGTVVDGSVESRWRRAVASLGLFLPWENCHAGR